MSSPRGTAIFILAFCPEFKRRHSKFKMVTNGTHFLPWWYKNHGRKQTLNWKNEIKVYNPETMSIAFTFYFLLYGWEDSIGFAKISNIRFWMDLHVLRCTKHDLIILRKCLSVCMSLKFCEHCISRTNAQKLIKLHIQLYLI